MLEQAITSRLAQVWTAIPAYVTAVNLLALTVEAQPCVRGRVMRPDGAAEFVDLPLLLDCPIVFPHAGGASLTFPVAVGDEVLIVFSSRGIDFWWQNGGVQPPPEIRMHDLSDGFAIPGVWSQPKRLSAVAADAVQLRTDDKKAYIEIKVGSKDIGLVTSGNLLATVSGSAQVSASEGMTITAPTVTINGNLILNGAFSSNKGASGASGARITGDVVADGISLKTHVHGGVESGSSTSGAPR